MAILLSLLTNKYTWYALGAAILAAFLYFGVYQPYEEMKGQAALVPGLIQERDAYKSQITSADSRVAQALVDMKMAQAARDQAISDLGKWNDLKTGLNAKLSEMSKNASATTNAICQPSDGERQLWNATLAALTGSNPGDRSVGTGSQVPSGSAGVH